MAEALLRRILHERGYDHVDVASSGVAACDGVAASPGARAAMAQLGLDLSRHASRALTWEALVDADWVLAMEHVHLGYVLNLAPGAAYKCRLLGEYNSSGVGEDIPDPFGQPPEVFAHCADRLASCLTAFVERELVSGSRPQLALASDHHGVELKGALVGEAQAMGWRLVDCGASGSEAVDYPDLAWEVARLVVRGRVNYGILVCDSGLGMDIAANKLPGVRAALCHDVGAAEMARRHVDANVLVLGADGVSQETALEIFRVWMGASFEGERHAARLAKLSRYEALIQSLASNSRSRS